MPELKSSNLASAEYSPEAQEMTITFHSGSTYTYSGVDQVTYDDLLGSNSPGRYFAEHIKDKFSFVKG